MSAERTLDEIYDVVRGIQETLMKALKLLADENSALRTEVKELRGLTPEKEKDLDVLFGEIGNDRLLSDIADGQNK